MKRKRLKSILACMLVLSMVFRVQSAVFAAEADNTLGPKEIMDDTTTLNSGIAPVNVEESDSSFFEVTNLNEMIGAFAQINETQGDYTISLKDNIVLAGGSEKPFKVPAGCTVTLLGNGHTITYNNDDVSAQSNLTLGADGGILNLGNDSRNELIITTNNNQNHADPLLVILSGGTVNMYDGVTLTGNVCTSSNAGGVDIQEGTFNMFGGTISKCETYFGLGGGVRVCADIYTLNTAVAAFNMYGGTISENKATYAYGGYGDGGGVAVMNSNSTFTMTDGLIEKNQADYRGGGICNLFGGNTVINGGVIKENTAIKQYGGGICNYHGTMKIKNVTIENNGARNGGGIGSVYLIEYQDYYLSKMDISNCKIQNNSATYGGGMYSTSSPDVSLSDCTITANEASYGGGAYVYKSDDTTFVNSKISGNLADYGGGVYVNAADVTFVKSEISGNTAGIGGGLYGYAASTATAFISAGEAGNIICNNALLNTEGVFATDVYLNGASAKATLPAAKEMNRTFLADGQNQIIDGWYQDSADSRYTHLMQMEKPFLLTAN